MGPVNRLLFSFLISSLYLLMPTSDADAFCGFYVAGAETDVYNNATMVVMMREGTTTVLSMRNNYQGPPEDFAMIVPVPEILQEENVKTLSAELFHRVDKLAAPRLVEYWEQDPCPRPVSRSMDYASPKGRPTRSGGSTGSGFGRGAAPIAPVVEAEFTVGEYEIVILSAKDAVGLDNWITANGYKIPPGAAEHLRPYVAQGSKFFVAKVNPQKVKFKNGMASLSPLRFHYNSKDFNLPIRLGLINAKDKQDLIVHILGKQTRYEVANYNNVTIPTNLLVNNEVRSRYGEFYAALFDSTTEKNPKSVVTEYSWDSSTCDPCPGSPLREKELKSLGLDVIEKGLIGEASSSRGTGAINPRLQPQRPTSFQQAGIRLRQTKASDGLDSTIIRRYIRRNARHLAACYTPLLFSNPKLRGMTKGKFMIEADGKVTRANVKGIGTSDAKRCVKTVLQKMTLPKPSNGKRVRVTTEFEVYARTPPRQRRPSAAGGWVLTRLHARYDRTTLGEDLRFQKAEPLQGGRGGASDNISQEATKGEGRNQFQGRYIIRHPWQGAIECQSPKRGVWGRPPSGVSGSSSPQAATDLAFATRGKMTLSNMLATPFAGKFPDNTVENQQATPVPANVDSEKPKKAPESESAPPKSESESKGCSSGGGSGGGAALLLLFCFGILSRRKRDLAEPALAQST